MDYKIVLEELYKSEINFSIVTFWDAGFDIKLGDELNGFVAQGNRSTYREAVEQLREWALEHYPNSLFAIRQTPADGGEGDTISNEHTPRI